jgi:O-methyltransferase involved in polyketide biosynthesis
LFDDPLAERFVAAAGQDAALPGQVSRQPAAIDDFWSWFAHFAPVRIRFFDDCVRAACAGGCRVTVEADLRRDWATPLRQAGFRPEEPTFWLAEGLLAYLTVAERDQLLDTVDALSAPGSTFALEYVTKRFCAWTRPLLLQALER